ncbi:hypothetical protein D3C77_388960 [compost metagenome]
MHTAGFLIEQLFEGSICLHISLLQIEEFIHPSTNTDINPYIQEILHCYHNSIQHSAQIKLKFFSILTMNIHYNDIFGRVQGHNLLVPLARQQFLKNIHYRIAQQFLILLHILPAQIFKALHFHLN